MPRRHSVDQRACLSMLYPKALANVATTPATHADVQDDNDERP